MHTDKRLTSGKHSNHGEELPYEGATPSVWIDPVVQHNASYLMREHEKWGAAEIVRRSREEAGEHQAQDLGKHTHVAHPITPIPPRASAQPAQAVKVRPRYSRSIHLPEESDITRIPTLPQPIMWQYESAEYKAESSLSSLSLVASEPKSERLEVDLSEVDTLPGKKEKSSSSQALALYAQQSIAEIDTVPPAPITGTVPPVDVRVRRESATRRDITARTQSKVVESDGASWTAGSSANSIYAQRIAGSGRSLLHRQRLALNPLDAVRWWLLYPGRIEFFLWLGGTVVLVSVTCLLLFVSLLSLGWANPTLSGSTSVTPVTSSGVNSAPTGCSSNSNPPPCPITTTSPTGLRLTLLGSNLLVAGMQLHLEGQGFSHNGLVDFWHDGSIPCAPNIKQANEQGEFIVDIATDANWKAAPHVIMAHDDRSNSSISLTITLAPPAFGKSATPTPFPPDMTPTSTPGDGTGGGSGGSNGGGPGPLPTPVAHTPVPVTPTAGVTPVATPTQAPPAPSPTAGKTPTATPSPTTKATPDAPNGSKVMGMQQMSLESGLPSSLEEFSVGPWLWILLAGYTGAMLLLGLASLLYHRERSRSH